jgi:hypothetical protein
MDLCKIMGIDIVLVLNNGEIVNLEGVGWGLALDL